MHSSSEWRVTELERLIGVLSAADVRFIVIGGVALVLRGSTRMTVDLDVCYARDRDNLTKLAAALAPFHPRLRGAPPELPFQWDAPSLASGLNFTLTTDLGDLDIFGEVPGLGGFDAVASGSSSMHVAGLDVRVLDVEGLEKAKRAAGRAKDLLDLAELAEIKKRRR